MLSPCIRRPHHFEVTAYFFAFFFAADFLALTGDFLAAFFFVAFGIVFTFELGAADVDPCGATTNTIHHKWVCANSD
jgi:hypothetical protein